MLMNVIILVILALAVVPVKTNENANWDHFDEFGATNVRESLALVKALPVSHFFDVIKGGYRSAVLGVHIEDILPELTFRVEKKLYTNAKTTQNLNISILDTNLALMHCIVSVQYVADMIGSLNERIRSYLQFREVTSQRLDAMMKKASALESSSNMEILMTAAINQLALLNTSILHERLKSSLLAQYSEMQYNEREKNRLGRHRNLETEIRTSFNTLISLHDEKSKNMTKMFENSMNTFRLIEFKAEDHEYASTIELLKNDIKLLVEGIQARYKEEARAERLNEQLHINIMRAKSSSNKQLTVQVIHALCDEIFNRFRIVLDDPYGTFLWLRTTLIVVCAFVIVYELFGFLVIVSVQIMNGKGRVIFSRVRNTKKVTGADDDEAVLPHETMSRLAIISDNLRMSLALKQRLLPIVLINGPAGVGKTMCALSIAKVSARKYSVISGSDLAAYGTKAGAYLRNIFDQSSWGFQESKLLILDEPDTLIARRAHNVETANSCFYILLQALRENNSHYSVIITTSRTVAEIDAALLDRVDSIISLSLPAAEERAKVVLKYCKATLSRYIGMSNLDELEAKLKTSSFSSSSSASYSSKGDPIFDLSSCVQYFVRESNGWSCREIAKVITNIQSRVLASHTDGLLTSELWKAEVSHWVAERARTGILK